MRVHRNGMHAVHRLRDEVDRVFGNVLRELPGFVAAQAGVFPPLNVWEDKENVYAEAELPGLKLDDLEVFVKGAELTLGGERKEEAAEGAGYHRRERGMGRFSRTVRLPVEVNADKVEATLSNGVLNLKLPKSEAARPRKIEVKGA